jgi:hypothetical protein
MSVNAVAAIAAIPYGNQLAIFVTDQKGNVLVNAGYPQTNDWPGWAPVGQGGFAPYGAVVAVPWIDSLPALFAIDGNGNVCSTAPGPPPPAPPANFHQISLTQSDGENIVYVGWTGSANDGSTYTVGYHGTHVAKPKRPDNNGTASQLTPSTAQVSLTSGYDYHLWVVAQNSGGVSAQSNQIRVNLSNLKT